MAQVFVKLLSQHKKHQKDELLEDPAARSHQFSGRSHFRMLGSPDGICLDTRIAGLRRGLAHRQMRCGFQYRFCVRNRVGRKGCEVFPSICRLCVLTKRRSWRSMPYSGCLALCCRWSRWLSFMRLLLPLEVRRSRKVDLLQGTVDHYATWCQGVDQPFLMMIRVHDPRSVWSRCLWVRWRC